MTKYSEVMGYLHAMGLNDDLDSFSARKRTQKIVYLLKQFDPELKFGYAWYLHGPYSPDLTRTLFNSDPGVANEHTLTKKELEIANTVRNFLADDFYSVDTLELIVSLIYLIKHGAKQQLDTKHKIISFLKSKKPRFSNEQIEASWLKIEQSKYWKPYLAKLSG